MNLRQKVFVKEYLLDFNATRAATAAGYSKKSARFIGNENLTKPYIQKAIQNSHETRLERLGISSDRVLRELAFADPRKFFNDDGSAKAISELDDDTAAALAGLEQTELKSEESDVYGFTKKIKLADKGINLERLGKHLGLFKESARPPSDERSVVKINLAIVLSEETGKLLSETVDATRDSG